MSITKLFLQFFYNLTGWYSSLVKSPRRFMNLGYHDPDSPLNLKETDFQDRSFIRLYKETISDVDLNGKNVLEIGCGRGGGSYFFAEYSTAKKVLGMDLSPANIKLCNKFYKLENVSFIEGNANKFEFKQEQFDVIVNLESSHCYPSKQDFFNRVKKTLKDGGTFAYADLIDANKIKQTEAFLLAAGFNILSRKDFTPFIVNSIELNSAKQSPFITKFPWLIPRFIKNINVVTGSDVHIKLLSRNVVYYGYTLVKSTA